MNETPNSRHADLLSRLRVLEGACNEAQRSLAAPYDFQAESRVWRLSLIVLLLPILFYVFSEAPQRRERREAIRARVVELHRERIVREELGAAVARLDACHESHVPFRARIQMTISRGGEVVGVTPATNSPLRAECVMSRLASHQLTPGVAELVIDQDVLLFPATE
jgi:hypothetical protein